MKKTERLKALLGRGYFPEELPPPFNTGDLATHRESILKAWNALKTSYPKTTFEIYSNPRIKRSRRSLAIVNPIAQTYLSALISENWGAIHKHLKKSKYSIEVPQIENGSERAIPPPDFSFVAIRRNEISAAFEHALVSDISRFYGTLYTHVIPWALHGKSWCKANLYSPGYEATLGVRLDKAVGKGQDNQTIGIPIGPDTSRILSEIVAVSIDQYVQDTLGLDGTRSFRHVDDWYIGFDSAGEAEDAIASLAKGCRDFELELNGDKTRSFQASSGIDRLWPTELREYRFGQGPKNQARSLEHYFIKAFQFSNDNLDQNVLDFAVKRTKSLKVDHENWRGYETFLLKAARSNATVIPAIVEILVSYNHYGFALDKVRITKLVEDLIRQNAPVAHHSEVAWALFLAKALRLKLSKHAGQLVSELESAVCALLALDLRQSKLFKSALDTSLWQQSLTNAGLTSNMWLLAYEADLKGWMVGTVPDFVDKHKYFSVLKQKKISFYDVTKNIKNIRNQKPKPHTAAFIEFIRQINEAGFPAPDFSMVP